MTKIDQIIRLMAELDRGYDRTLNPRPVGRTVLQPTDRYGDKLQTLFAPDEGDGLPNEPEVFIPTEVPIATVLPADKNQSHVRGYIPNPRTNRSVSYNGMLERVAAYISIANPGVISVEDQPAAILLENDKNEVHSHRTDYRIRLARTNHTIILGVRPLKALDKQDLRNTVARINAGYLDGFADEAIILTERELTYEQAWNAKSTLRGLRGRNVDHCEWLTDKLMDIHGWIEIRDLISGLPNALGWNAVWCLIFDGLLQYQRNIILPNAPFVTVDRAKLAEVR